MAKSLLSSFQNDFNRTISIYKLVKTENEIWEEIESWPTESQSWIKCLLLLNKQRYDAYISNEVEYIKTTHKIRMDFWPEIEEWDKIQDNNWVWYTVKFADNAPGFDWVDDHLLVLVDKIEK